MTGTFGSPEVGRWIWEALEPQWRAEIIAGKYNETYPALRKLYIDVTAEDAEVVALLEQALGVKLVDPLTHITTLTPVLEN